MTKPITAFLLLLATIFSTTGACYASKADELLRDADKRVAKARTAKQRVDKVEDFTKAIEKYSSLANDSKYTWSVQAATAAYQVAAVNVELAGLFRGDKERHNYLYAAFNAAQSLLNTYDKPRDRLLDSLETSEADQVMALVAKAHALKNKAADELDKINSKDIKYKVIDFFVSLTGRKPAFSYWFAIILITLLVKIIITPLTHAQFKSMKEMQKIAPLVKEIQEKYKGDQKTIGEKTMALYKEHSINPFASCLPLLVQMPILMLLFYTIKSYEFQFAHGQFLWIGSALSHWEAVRNPMGGQQVWITARNLAEPDLILVVLYAVSMYVSTKLSSVDPTQAEQQKMMAIMMPIMFSFIFAGFQSAFLLYWLVFNILQTAQQYFIIHGGGGQTPPPVPAPVTPPEPKPDEGSGDSGRVRRRPRRRR